MFKKISPDKHEINKGCVTETPHILRMCKINFREFKKKKKKPARDV